MEGTSTLPWNECWAGSGSAGGDAANGLGAQKPRVLIVDDSLTVRMDLRQTFESAEFDVTLCETLAAARAALAGQAPSLVVLDVLLPDGDGIDLLREIKSTLAPALPVMLLSTEAEVGDRVRGLKTGADDYVGKPYDATYVLARAQELIGAATYSPKPAAPRLLLIDDSATSRQQFQSILETAGYSVVTAESGEEGLRTAFASRPDAIIVDRVLPGGIDGDTVIRRLKQDVTLRNTPCLLLTASTEEGEERRALDAGADAYLSKEVDVEVFLARMVALMRSGSPAPAMDPPVSSLLGAKKILAVDDSLTYLNELSAELRQEGYDVIQALSGNQALDLLEVQPVDGILLDVRMPGLSGNDTCRAIKQRPAMRGIPLLMLTAADGPDALIEGINSGADDYISKSGDFTVLKARLRAQLRRKQFEDEYRLIREELLRKELETAQARADQEIAEARAAMVDELESKNRELEAFAYAVSHDLRSPLRTIRGFSQAVLDDFAGNLPAGVAEHLGRVQAGAARMGKLIDALLELSRSTRADLRRQPIDLSQLAHTVAAELAECSPDHKVDFQVEEGLTAQADPALMRVVFNNLLGNAWKFTSKTAQPRVEVGALERAGQAVYFVRDNGVGFDSASARKLFQAFERLHPATEFPGAGIGLATVRRIIERHRGQVWAESAVRQGATFFFTLDAASSPKNSQERGLDSLSLAMEQK
ncbi:MAG: response regulator [Acidobacteriia bacterium]|nr:response regulator [Terriglobia bacterium]